LCSNEGERDFDAVEVANLDDDRGSVVSSTMSSVLSCDNSHLQDDTDGIADVDSYDNPDWENLNETKHKSNIANTLKKLGNTKKKTTSPLILKDMLGANAEALGISIMKRYVKTKITDSRIINDMYRSVKCVEQLFES
jgi:hypothetical protein